MLQLVLCIIALTVLICTLVHISCVIKVDIVKVEFCLNGTPQNSQKDVFDHKLLAIKFNHVDNIVRDCTIRKLVQHIKDKGGVMEF